MMPGIGERARQKLGWCPHHSAAQAAMPKIGAKFLVIGIVSIFLLTAAIVMMTAPAKANVVVWAFRVDDTGTKHFIGRLPATEDTSGRLGFYSAGAADPALHPGKYALIIEHPGADGRFRLMLDGTAVKLRQADSRSNPIMLFKIGGPGSLQQEDAY